MRTSIRMWPSGRLVNLANPSPRDIRIGDIAHHLSMICRFTGGVKQFYSVAEHSVLVRSLLAEQGFSERVQYTGLLHDAQEAYLQDVPSPLKSLLPEYQAIEANFESLIGERLNTDMHIPAVRRWVKAADDRARRIEDAILRGRGSPPAAVGRQLGLSPEEAEELFLDNFYRLQYQLDNDK